MNNVISHEALAKMLAEKCNIDIAQSRLFITQFQTKIIEKLTSGAGEAIIPNLGKLQVTDRATGTVKFTPDAQIAEEVNEPFAFFEPVKLVVEEQIDNPLDERQLTAEETPTERVLETLDITSTTDPTTSQPDIDDQPTETDAESELTEVVNTIEPTTEATPEPTPKISATTEKETVATVEETEPEEEEEVESRHFSPIIAYVLGILTGMVITCIAIYFLYPPINFNESDNSAYTDDDTPAVTEQVEETTVDTEIADKKTESVPEVETATSTEPRVTTTPEPTPTPASTQLSPVTTDTITSTYFLAGMARKHYGKMEFWVYIYKENESKLGHPDRVPAGTVVTIPPAAKYHIDTNDPQSVERARQLATEIYAKYK